MGDVVIGQIQDAKVLHTGNLRRHLGEALVAEVEFPKIWINHSEALTLRSRSMEGSDVKQRDDVLARHG